MQVVQVDSRVVDSTLCCEPITSPAVSKVRAVVVMVLVEVVVVEVTVD